MADVSTKIISSARAPAPHRASRRSGTMGPASTDPREPTRTGSPAWAAGAPHRPQAPWQPSRGRARTQSAPGGTPLAAVCDTSARPAVRSSASRSHDVMMTRAQGAFPRDLAPIHKALPAPQRLERANGARPGKLKVAREIASQNVRPRNARSLTLSRAPATRTTRHGACRSAPWLP
jgi:hypothetical protein